MRSTANKYRRFIFATLTASIMIIALLITFIISYTFGNEDERVFDKALNWQYETKGVVAVHSGVYTRYKNSSTDRALEELDINTLILGSSTLMQITRDMFPADILVHNTCKNGNPLNRTIAEANYYIEHYKDIKYIIMGFDWALNKPYVKLKPYDFKPKVFKDDTTLWTKLKDAITYQRVKVVLTNLYSDLTDNTETYRCPKEDNIGTDYFFPSPTPKICNGVRYDGSATFSDHRPLTQKEWESLLTHKYIRRYKKPPYEAKGLMQEIYFEEFAKIDQKLKKRGGKLILYVPPLLPKAAKTILKSEISEYMQRTFDDLEKWSKKYDLYTLNASSSEDFGCLYSDFLDTHHAFSACHRRIIEKIEFY